MCEDLGFISVFSVLTIRCHAIWLSSKTWHQHLQEVRGDAGVLTPMDSKIVSLSLIKARRTSRPKLGASRRLAYKCQTCFRLRQDSVRLQLHHGFGPVIMSSCPVVSVCRRFHGMLSFCRFPLPRIPAPCENSHPFSPDITSHRHRQDA